MNSSKVPKDKIFKKVINPYLTEVLQHPQSIEMREGMLHIRDVKGPKKIGSMEMRLEAMEQQIFKCQGMVERGLNANYTMLTEFTNKHKMDANDIGKHLSRLYDTVDQLQGQIYDLQNQNYEMQVMEAKERLPKETKGKAEEKNLAWDEVQSVLNREEVEEVDFLRPYLHLLSPSLIELLRFCETTRARNTCLTHEVVLLEKHIAYLQVRFRDMNAIFSLYAEHEVR
ncbi:40S ribosomal protein S5-1 [Hordeum vulgare]|nr:40S ribosomal protein S5-1 [Hordeum vulgare]